MRLRFTIAGRNIEHGETDAYDDGNRIYNGKRKYNGDKKSDDGNKRYSDNKKNNGDSERKNNEGRTLPIWNATG